jgi:hypothetical protein
MVQGLIGDGKSPRQGAIKGAARGGMEMMARGFGNQYSISNS